MILMDGRNEKAARHGLEPIPRIGCGWLGPPFCAPLTQSEMIAGTENDLGRIAAGAEAADVHGDQWVWALPMRWKAGCNGADLILGGVRQSALSESASAIMFKGCRRLAQCIWWGRGPVTRAF